MTSTSRQARIASFHVEMNIACCSAVWPESGLAVSAICVRGADG